MSTCSPIHSNALLLTLLLGTQAAYAEPEKAKSADTFVDGIGVNTHLLFSNYIDNLDTAILPKMQEIGIRNIRDGILLDDGLSKRGFVRSVRSESRRPSSRASSVRGSHPLGQRDGSVHRGAGRSQ